MRIEIVIDTENNSPQMVRSLLADIISKFNTEDEIETNASYRDENCGYSWLCLVVADEGEYFPDEDALLGRDVSVDNE